MAFSKREISHRYWKKNRERLNVKAREKYAAKKEYYKKYANDCYKKDPQKFIKRTSEYKRTHRDSVNSYKRAYRLSHLEKLREKERIRWQLNKERFAKRRKDCREWKKAFRLSEKMRPIRDRFYEDLWGDEWKRIEECKKANAAWVEKIVQKRRPPRAQRQALYKKFFIKN